MFLRLLDAIVRSLRSLRCAFYDLNDGHVTHLRVVRIIHMDKCKFSVTADYPPTLYSQRGKIAETGITKIIHYLVVRQTIYGVNE